MIRFACPGCATIFTAPTRKAGKATNCPKCQVAFQLPDAPAGTPVPPPPPPALPSAVIVSPPVVDAIVEAEEVTDTVEVQPCPGCASALSVSEEHVGQEIECPYCRTVYRAVRSDAPPPPKSMRGARAKTVLARLEPEAEKTSKRKRRDDDDEDDDTPLRRKPRPVDAGRPPVGSRTIGRIGVLSAGKMLAAVSFTVALIVGIIYTIIGVFFASALSQFGGRNVELFGLGLSLTIACFSLIIYPLLSALMGFVGGVVMAALYNLFASMFGGVEVEFE